MQSTSQGVYMTFATLKSYLYFCSVAYLWIWKTFAKAIISNDLLTKYATFFLSLFRLLGGALVGAKH
jgi:hypothetical protein